MAVYTQVNLYTFRDSLALNDPNKTIKGAYLDAEFGALHTASTDTVSLSGNNTITGNNSFSGTNSFSQAITVTGSVTITSSTGANSFVTGLVGGTNNPRFFVTSTESTGVTDINFSGTTGYSGTISVGGQPAITLSNARNVTVQAPGSGVALTVNGGVGNILETSDGTQIFGVQTSSGNVVVGSLSNHNFNFMANNSTKVQILTSGGLVMVGASGGDPGAGNINANALFQNGKAAMMTASKASTTARVSNTTPSADPDLQFTLPGAGTYAYRADLYFSAGASGATPGMKIGIAYSGTVAVTLPFNYFGFFGGAAQATNGPNINTTGNISVDTFTDSMSIRGTAAVTNGGVLSVTWSQQNSSASPTSMIAGSTFTVTRVG